MEVEFKDFRKIPRFAREVVVTEKIDGTNSCIFIGEGGEFLTGSRNRWITPEDDNYGFSAWAHHHRVQLMQLGPGYHYGEWWGDRIQRGYGMPKGMRHFSLFNVDRWCLYGTTPRPRYSSGDPATVKLQEELPPMVELVPVLLRCNMADLNTSRVLELLAEQGSHAAPGFKDPEGIVITHMASGAMFKRTIKRDGERKRA